MTNTVHPVALVTGAARRIGASIAQELHGAGYNVVIHYRSSGGEARKLAQQLNDARPHSAICLRANLQDTTRLHELAEQAHAEWGRVDALVNNASTFYPTALEMLDEQAFDDLVGSNFKAPLFLMHELLPALRETRGAVVNLVDPHRTRPLAGHAVYCAAKAALVMLTRSLALELAPEVRVNAVAPGAILWPEAQPPDAATKAQRLQAIPMQRLGQEREIARMVLFLLSADAAYTTGQIIDVDGGAGLNGV